MIGDTTRRACELVTGDRAEQHGDAQQLHECIAAFWMVYKDVEFTATEVAMMMALVKAARQKYRPSKLDNYVDMAGYADIAAEVRE